MSSKLNVDAEALGLLAEILKESELTELEYQQGEVKIRLSRTAGTTPVFAPQPLPTLNVIPPSGSGQPPLSEGHVPQAPETPPENIISITSPIVGTAYLAPQPGESPFIKEGDAVQEGQTLLIIEAMKVMNPIRAPQNGYVKKVKVHNAAPVEFAEELVLLDKNP
jgi:acetyl-CoA carboxylase biotin carboxyl carrier protein